MTPIETDYLVIGAGATGMAFTDALIDRSDVHVTIVDRRYSPGGHWVDAYPFVRLHQASQFYGVASTPLGEGRSQLTGPEVGLHERAGRSEIQHYYQTLMDRFASSGRVRFLSGCEYAAGDGEHTARHRLSGQEYSLRVRRRVVDAHYLEPRIPATSPPPFAIAADARVLPINKLVCLSDTPSQFVIIGSGKSATDAIIFLLDSGVDPDTICWIRPREPWMLNRAFVQPNLDVLTDMAAHIMEAAAAAASLDALFLDLEERGVMLRIDSGLLPTMAKTPTLARWELERLRSVEQVVRLGHVQHIAKGTIRLDRGTIKVASEAVVIHAAASGLRYPQLVPIWQSDMIRIQTIRAGFPCFCAALVGFVEATRDDDRERNRLCPPNHYGDSLAQWASMTVRGTHATRSFMAESDIAAWANACALYPGYAPTDDSDNADGAQARFAEAAGPGLERLAQLSGAAP